MSATSRSVNRQPINKACPGLPAKQHMSEIGSNQRRSCSPIIPSSGRSSSFIFASACINSDSASISAGSTVQFQSICHPSMTVTHLTKISVRHFAWKPVTWAKFLQVLPFVWPFQQCWVLNLRQWYKWNLIFYVYDVVGAKTCWQFTYSNKNKQDRKCWGNLIVIVHSDEKVFCDDMSVWLVWHSKSDLGFRGKL